MKRIKAPETKAERQGRLTKEGEVAFAKGGVKPAGSGRAKGVQNKHTVILKECITRAMEMVGNNNRGKDGAEGYLAHLAWKHPDIFGRLLEKMLPYSLSGAGGGPVQVEYTNKQDITLRLKERGLPMPLNLLEAPRRQKPTVEAEDADYEEAE